MILFTFIIASVVLGCIYHNLIISKIKQEIADAKELRASADKAAAAASDAVVDTAKVV
jgi:hypothetical protein